jgi:hypothetical protein
MVCRNPVAVKKSNVLKVLKMLNFPGTGRMRVFTAGEGW